MGKLFLFGLMVAVLLVLAGCMDARATENITGKVIDSADNKAAQAAQTNATLTAQIVKTNDQLLSQSAADNAQITSLAQGSQWVAWAMLAALIAVAVMALASFLMVRSMMGRPVSPVVERVVFLPRGEMYRQMTEGDRGNALTVRGAQESRAVNVRVITDDSDD